MKVSSRVTRSWFSELSLLPSVSDLSYIEWLLPVIDSQKLLEFSEDKVPMKEPSMEQAWVRLLQMLSITINRKET